MLPILRFEIIQNFCCNLIHVHICRVGRQTIVIYKVWGGLGLGVRIEIFIGLIGIGSWGEHILGRVCSEMVGGGEGLGVGLLVALRGALVSVVLGVA